VIRAVAAASPDERAFWARTIGRGRIEEGDLDKALALLDHHGTLASTRLTALDWAGRARAALAPLPAHPLRDMLTDLADYVVARLS
jgi:octaprenyl-diphosphate synthase